jgi:hypothetical protein
MGAIACCRYCGRPRRPHRSKRGVCDECQQLPRRARELYQELATEGWKSRGFDLLELAQAVYQMGRDGSCELDARQRFVLSRYVHTAAILVRAGNPDFAQSRRFG